jgi:pyruvate-ferredoxin/flavodoxin oxidoreductase
MTYGNVYVAQVAFGAKDQQTFRAFVEAASYSGPSLIIAYSHCIAHGYDLGQALTQHQLAVKTGYWPLYRFDPRLRHEGGCPLHLDSPAPTANLTEFAYNETRFRLLLQSDPERARELMDTAQANVLRRFALYQQLAKYE